MFSKLTLVSLLAKAAFAVDVVDTGYAKYLGNRTFPNAVAYLGIPYAEPPLGDRRFRAPLPLNTTRIAEESKGQVIDATQYPDFCIQGPIGGTDMGGAGSEDCLKLNIYAPANAKKGDKLPVLFYIHGGGYIFGNPRNWPFDHWIRQSPNVVVVSIYYRLDAFGFLTAPEFVDPKNGDNNAGFLDQIQALKWVQANIRSFGGDPSKVTINGQSAGGGSVEHHLLANEEPRLFSGAIAQSVARSRTPTPDQQKPLFDFFVSRAGCGTGELTEKLSCLRNASISVLARAQEAARTSEFGGPYNSFTPAVDGKVIIGNPTTLIRNGKFARVPVIVGATSNETGGSGDPTVALKRSYPLLSDSDIQDILAVAPVSDFDSVTQRNQVVTGESALRCAREVMGGAFSTAPKSWTYRYNQPNPTQGSATVAHAAENWMMFLGTNTGYARPTTYVLTSFVIYEIRNSTNGSTTFTPMTPVENAFAEELIAYWLSFVRSGDPNTFKLARSPVWPRYTLTGDASRTKLRIVLQEDPRNSTTRSGNIIEQEPENESRRCAVVASKSEQEQN
ncbi:alpha/beta-hydrolase [Marasmius fiardii PR-910]|nr:alpha/beta-hydrolase [Marasmius fiardii PR-910]